MNTKPGMNNPYPAAALVAGDIVRYAKVNGDERFAYGRVCVVENYADDHGVRTWYHVRWVDANGKPDSQTQQHAGKELERVK